MVWDQIQGLGFRGHNLPPNRVQGTRVQGSTRLCLAGLRHRLCHPSGLCSCMCGEPDMWLGCLLRSQPHQEVLQAAPWCWQLRARLTRSGSQA